jgi:hypothetical protein
VLRPEQPGRGDGSGGAVRRRSSVGLVSPGVGPQQGEGSGAVASLKGLFGLVAERRASRAVAGNPQALPSLVVR